MQDLSFNFNAGQMKLWDYTCELYIHSFENVYAVSDYQMEQNENQLCISASRVVWAGGQETVPAVCQVLARKNEPDKITISIEVDNFPAKIRCVRLVVKGLAGGCIANKLDLKKPPVTRDGIILKYPEGWRNLDTPMCILEHENKTLTCFRSLDTWVRDKRFVLMEKEDGIQAELIYEESAVKMGRSVRVPEWEISQPAQIADAYAVQKTHIETAYDLQKWEERNDVPAWAREISMVASIHGQHWCGYIFNDYAAMEKHLEWLADKIEGKRILVYMPGWEGRYYWKYGNYTADERMGGEQGLRSLVTKAKSLGIHLMPMFGINLVNAGLENYEQWGEVSEFRTASGSRCSGSVDWDASRHYDHASNRNLNPAAPGWQEQLVTQIHNVVDTYGFEAVFLDIAAVWLNDPSHELYGGMTRLIKKIREGHDQLLVTGEAWYDGLAKLLPVVQSGHSDGPMHYFDAFYPAFFDDYCRCFAHLCLGDPGRGSSGVHELGTNWDEWRTPLRKGIWPTVTIVEDTLEKAEDKVLEIIEDAKLYAEQYL